MNQTDDFLVGYQEATEATPEVQEVRDSSGKIVTPFRAAQPAREHKEGIKVSINTPIPFPVLLKALEYFKFKEDGGIDLHATAQAGEIIVKSQVVKNDNWKQVEPDGRLMYSLCLSVATIYLIPENTQAVKKNSPLTDSSNSNEE